MKLTMSIIVAMTILMASANATVITNGDFETGDTTGFDVLVAGPSTEPFVTVQQDGDNDFLQLSAGNAVEGFLFATLSQSLTITAEAFLLNFDAALLSAEDDTGPDEAGPFVDFFSVGIEDEDGDFTGVFGYDEVAGARTDPFNQNVFPAGLTSPSNSFFDTGVVADLSSLIGQTILLEISIFAEFDQRTVTFAADNFALTGGSASEVPIPAPVALFATGLLLLRRFSRDTA